MQSEEGRLPIGRGEVSIDAASTRSWAEWLIPLNRHSKPDRQVSTPSGQPEGENPAKVNKGS
jgi:hypothetical protein